MARDLGVADRVEFTGLMPPAEVAGRLAAASILVRPEHGLRHFGALYVAAQALRVSRSWAAPSSPRICRRFAKCSPTAQTALLVPAGDPAALAAAIERLIADPVLRPTTRRRRARAAHRTLPGAPGQAARGRARGRALMITPAPCSRSPACPDCGARLRAATPTSSRAGCGRTFRRRPAATWTSGRHRRSRSRRSISITSCTPMPGTSRSRRRCSGRRFATTCSGRSWLPRQAIASSTSGVAAGARCSGTAGLARRWSGSTSARSSPARRFGART